MERSDCKRKLSQCFTNQRHNMRIHINMNYQNYSLRPMELPLCPSIHQRAKTCIQSRPKWITASQFCAYTCLKVWNVMRRDEYNNSIWQVVSLPVCSPNHLNIPCVYSCFVKHVLKSNFTSYHMSCRNVSICELTWDTTLLKNQPASWENHKA